jgi:predicted nucleic acid-binding protein
VQVITRPDCLDELCRVLAYEQFHIDATRQAAIHAAYAARAAVWPEATLAKTELAAALPRCQDRDDQKFVALAWDAGAHALVTRDKLLLRLARWPVLRERFAILTPERLCQSLAPGADATRHQT